MLVSLKTYRTSRTQAPVAYFVIQNGLQSFLWKGVSLGYVGMEYNLKDLKKLVVRGATKWV